MLRKIETLKKILKFNFLNLLRRFLRFINTLFIQELNRNPLIFNKLLSKEHYLKLFNDASIVNYSKVDEYENESQISINTDWLNELALLTQITIKKNDLCYAHGRVIYTALSNRIRNLNKNENITIIETGTARGFSSLCMAKSMEDNKFFGKILTLDQLPHDTEIYWNSISDHINGKISRRSLLIKWQELINKYILFFNGDSRVLLNSMNFSRVHFAFLDGCHTYDDVIYEFNSISDHQLSGDVIVFDDYTTNTYDGVVKAVDEICSKYSYKKKIIYLNKKRSLLIASKL